MAARTTRPIVTRARRTKRDTAAELTRLREAIGWTAEDVDPTEQLLVVLDLLGEAVRAWKHESPHMAGFRGDGMRLDELRSDAVRSYLEMLGSR